jgi:hypothetical protein
MIPDELLRRGYASEHRRAADNLRRALDDIQRAVARLLADLDADPSAGLYGGAARNMASSAADAAVRAGELDMANQLSFLLPVPEED